jgi:hypothetical protein
MRHTATVFILFGFCFVATSFAAGKGDSDRFDGTWETILSCPNASGALGYSDKFPSVVKEGNLHAEKGAKGKPGWLSIDGSIKPDGTANLYADGLVGAADAAVGHRPAGTEYGYHIDARFDRDQGTGKRVEGRRCDLTFTRTKEK